MYLKKIEMQGFKSFADKIQLEFKSGITSIVGPNGSGKSNIADAVRWVLGEQSAKTLRGSKMEDIIFAGTEHRKPLGFAEVSLTVDNSDGSLPVEFTEVTVTRRVFRSGESEYFINKTPCRLKDINELFVDTGIGKDGYSIISQGKVDEILSSKSEDRRHIFEEASGIMKYKLRKIETERKLELTEQNLIRINDILNELETQLEPLRQQSETAKRLLALREELKGIEVNVYIENISRFRDRLNEYNKDFSVIEENINNENARLEEITNSNKEKNDRLKFLEEKLEAAKQQFYSIDGNLEKCNSDIKLNNEKISNMQQNIERLDSEISAIDEKLQALSRESASKEKKLEYLNRTKEEYSAKLQEYEKEMEAVLAALDKNEVYIEGLKTAVMDKVDLLADKRVQLNSEKSHLNSLKSRKNSIDSEVKQILFDIDRENMKKEDLLQSIYNAKASLTRASERLEQLNGKKAEKLNTLSDKRKLQNTLRSEIQFKASRSKMLNEMEQNLEGYNRSVKQVLQACREDRSFGAGIRGALAQLITVDKKYETAIEMSLGSALQNIVTDSEEDAKRAIEYLKIKKFGRATFLPISSVRGKYLEDNILKQLKGLKGFCGIGSDIVEYDPDYKNIIISLLGRVVIVDDLDSGIAIARKFGYSFRIVTLEGEILNTSGAMTGGSIEGRGTGILSRSREIIELREEREKLEEEYNLLEKSINELIEEINTIENDISAEEKLLKDNELIKLRDENHLAQVNETISRYASKAEMLRQEKNQLSRQETEINSELDKFNKEIAGIEEEITKTKEIIEQHQAKHKEDQLVRDRLHRDITDYKISVNSIKESIEGVLESIERLTGEKDISLKSISKYTKEIERNKAEIESLKEKNSGLEKTIKSYEVEKTGKTLEIDSITEEKRMIEEELQHIIDKITQSNKTVMLLREDLNRIEVKKAKLESELESIQNRLWDEYELTYTNALELKRDIGSMTQAQKKINELKNEIRDLGPVNVAAIDEYVKTKERYEFMSVQKNDMEQAKEKLHRVINEMTSIMKRQFMEQFKLINYNFNKVFKELFDGGRAELILSDMDNILESGIEIEVQPPGKKLQNMMLLSGGERAFTAIALLFSILQMKPTPFCILDEIEAALDDANVYKFAQYLSRFTDKTQFIMVTHRKGTMESSDALYGVTMQEKGISKVVSMKLDEKAS